MSNTTFLDTYLALRASSEAERKQRERERQTLLNTMALAEAELAKPEYFGFLIERDRMGYLEALSQTKTTFRGINPHDPFDGIVLNGGINPDFVMMLEKNFFKENSENLDKDELYFVRYQAERNKIIEWLNQEFQALSIDDEYLIREAKASQEELFKRLQSDEWIFTVNVSSGKLNIFDKKQYLKGVENQELVETLPKKFCIYKDVRDYQLDLNRFFDLKYEEERKKQEEKLKQQELGTRNTFASLAVVAVIITLIILLAQVMIKIMN